MAIKKLNLRYVISNILSKLISLDTDTTELKRIASHPVIWENSSGIGGGETITPSLSSTAFDGFRLVEAEVDTSGNYRLVGIYVPGVRLRLFCAAPVSGKQRVFTVTIAANLSTVESAFYVDHTPSGSHSAATEVKVTRIRGIA